MAKSKNQQRDMKVVKKNALIQKSTFSLSLLQHKIVSYFISKCKPYDDITTVYTVSLKEFCEVCGIKVDGSNNISYIKKVLNDIYNQSICIEDEQKIKWVRWFDKLEIQKGKWDIVFSFSSTMEEYLFNLRYQFTQYPLLYILPMKHKSSIRLYELLKSFSNLGYCSMTLDVLKKRIDAQNYTKSYDLKRRCIDPAIEEINTYTDIRVSYTLRKDGREYKEISFIIEEQPRLLQHLNEIRAREALTPDPNTTFKAFQRAIEQVDKKVHNQIDNQNDPD